MKIFFISDIHLEGGIGELQIPECDVILLAGDICSPSMAHHNKCTFPIKKNLADKINKRYQKFFEKVSKRASHVYYIYGNHEFYGTSIQEAKMMLNDFISPYKNIHILENESVDIGDGIKLFGGTMWTDLKRGDPIVEFSVARAMNDFLVIYNGDEKMGLDYVKEENQKFRVALEKFLIENKDNKTIVMSHHAPSWECVKEEYRYDIVSYGYANTGLDYLIYDDGPDVWIHGHMHKRDEIQFSEKTKIICNARGYFGEPMAKTGGFCEILI